MSRINTKTGRDKNVPACLVLFIAIFIAICAITLSLKPHKIRAIKIAPNNADTPKNKKPRMPKGPETLGFRAFYRWCERGDLKSHAGSYTD